MLLPLEKGGVHLRQVGPLIVNGRGDVGSLWPVTEDLLADSLGDVEPGQSGRAVLLKSCDENRAGIADDGSACARLMASPMAALEMAACGP